MMDNKKDLKWYDNGNTVINFIIGIILVIIICSQSFALGQTLSLQLFGSIINHNSIYILVLVYFIFLKTKFGKKYFNYLNVVLVFIYFISAFTSLLTVVQSFSLDAALNFMVSFVLLIYMSHTLFRDTLVWKELSLDKSPFNELTNDWLFYAVVLMSISALIINLISTVVLSGVLISLLDAIYVILLGRYIYLYRDYLDKNKIDSKNKGNFDDIKKSIKDAVDDTTDKVKSAIEDAKIDEKLNNVKDTVVGVAKDLKDETVKIIKDNELDKAANQAMDDIEKTAKDLQKKVDKKVEDIKKKSTKNKKGDNE